MGDHLRALCRRLTLVAAVGFGCAAMIVCSVGPIRPQLESSNPMTAVSAWAEDSSDSNSNSRGSGAKAGRNGAHPHSVSGPREVARAEAAHRGKALEDPSGRAMNAFYESLATTERRAEPGLITRVSCFGDSHTAADFMTGQLRRRMQKRFGDGGHGFIAAGRPWPSYRHRNIRNGSKGIWESLRVRHRSRSDETDGRLGLAGVAIETDRTHAKAWVSTVDSGPVGLSASSFELYFMAHPRGGRIGLNLDGEEVERLDSRADESVALYHRIDTDDGPHRFEVETQGRGMVRLFGIVVEREGPGVTVDSLGINGARITAMLAWDEDVFGQNLAHRGPDLVVLWYGANSVSDDWYSREQYQQWVLDALSRIRRAVPEASCLLVGPPDMARANLAYHGPSGTPPALHRLIAAQRDAASLAGCGFFDSFEAMGGQDSNLAWAEREPSLVSGDGIHFTAPGYEELANLLYDALIDGYERYLEAHPDA